MRQECNKFFTNIKGDSSVTSDESKDFINPKFLEHKRFLNLMAILIYEINSFF